MRIHDIAVNNLRVVAAEMSTRAKSGHPGIALGSAPILYSLYNGPLKYDYSDPSYFNRDRFVMSAGHGSSILYATLSLFGFDVTKEDLMNFRQFNSRTPGHPEYGVTSGVDCSTGPLGQGVANAVGMAIAEKHLAEIYNKEDIKIIDNHIYALCGEGCLMEGISYEALCLAGTLNLNNLTIIYDRNNISIEGDTRTAFNINIEAYFQSLGFKVYNIKNGNNTKAINAVLSKCKNDIVPTVVIVDTEIGYGSPVHGQAKSHGSPLSDEQITSLRETLKVTTKPFEFDTDIKIKINKVVEAKKAIIDAERKNLEVYKEKYPEDYEKLFNTAHVSLESIKEFKKLPLENKASRDMSHDCLQAIAERMPNFMGGCADLASSTKAFIKDSDYISKSDFSQKNIHFGIREHAMGAICNGMALCGVKAFASTFMSFTNYMFPAMRMACLDKLPVLYIFSHDSFMVGEDGPTHQSVEQLVSMRSIPNLSVFRPFNIEEMKAAFAYYLENETPTVISTSKNSISDFHSDMDMAIKGGYIISPENKKCSAVIVATGMEVDTALEVQKILAEDKVDVRVVSMPNISVFEKQSKNYISRIFPQDCSKRVVIEPASKNGWAKIVGKDALFITRDEFGKSAKPKDLTIEFGFDPEQIADKVKEYIRKY